jgi:hypothetical protein
MEMIRKAMTLRRLKRFGAVGFAAVLAFAAMLIPQLGFSAKAAQSEESESHEKGLQGTWRLTVQPFICQTGVPIGPPFASLSTFASGGTLSGATSGPAFLPGQRTPDFGTWSRTDEHTFSVVAEAFILFDSSMPPYILSAPLPPSLPIFHRGTQRITQTIEVNNDDFTSHAVTQFFDPNGKLLSRNCAMAAAHRF